MEWSDSQVGWALCVTHHGQHGVLDGHCILVGREKPRPFTFRMAICPTCGDEICYRTDRHGRTRVLGGGTDQRHYHAPDLTGERLVAVASGLEGMQATLATMLAERRTARVLPPPPPAPSQSVLPRRNTPATPQQPKDGTPVPETVVVWSANDGSGA